MAAQVQATPFPPRNPCQQGKLCPSTAPSPAQAAAMAPASGNRTNRASTQASTVLPRSPASTSMPGPNPHCAMTLAIPGLPEPMSNTLFPVRLRTTHSAVRKFPSAYPIRIENSRNILPLPPLLCLFLTLISCDILQKAPHCVISEPLISSLPSPSSPSEKAIMKIFPVEGT